MPARTETSSMDTGSSAMSSRGPMTSAAAIATRWRWPPESSCGYRSRNASAGERPTVSSASAMRRSRSLRGIRRSCTSSGSIIVSCTVNRGSSDSYGSW